MKELKKELCKMLEMSSNGLVTEEELKKNDRFAEHIDSIMFVEYIVEIEEKYGFEFDDDMLDLEQVGTISDLATYIERKVNLK